MASRLSESALTSVLDAGQHGLSVQMDPGLIELPDVDLDALLEAEDPASAVQAVAPGRLFQAIVKRGAEDCLEVLPLLSQEQVVKVFDYDVWREDRLEPLKAMRWLNLFKEHGNEELIRRFRDLDEEYQIALVAPLVTMYDEDEMEKLPEEKQDLLHRLPCGTLGYEIRSPDPRLEEFVTSLVAAALEVDVSYAYSLLAHAAYMPPNESEAQLAQFRRARLEEDGFVTYEESLAAFRPTDLAELRLKWAAVPAQPSLMPEVSQSGAHRNLLARLLATADFSPEEREQITCGLAFLANSLCAAAGTEPDDASGLRRLLQHTHALTNLGLEYVANADLAKARLVLSHEHAQVLFRAGITLVRSLGEKVLSRLATYALPDVDKLTRCLAMDKRGVLELTLERSLLPVLGFERVEVLKGLFNRFPLLPVALEKDDGAAPRVTFKPVARLADLGQLAASVDRTLGLLALARWADQTNETRHESLDRRLTTALAQVLLGDEFRVSPLTRDDLAKLVELPEAAVQALNGDVFSSAEGYLRSGLQNAESWSVSAEISAKDPLFGVIDELSDLALRLGSARQAARSQGSERDLSEIFSSQIILAEARGKEGSQ